MKRALRESDAVRVLALGVLLAVLLVLRRPDALTGAQFWAEDGVVFFAGDLMFGGWAALLQPYSGYLHLVPRIVAAVADPLPPASVPLFYDACAIALAACCCALFASAWYRFLIASDLIRAAVCVLVAVVPFADELVGTISNVQWYLSVAALLLVVAPSPPRLALRTAAASAAVLLIALSAPQIVVFVPLAAWLAVRRRWVAAAPCLALLAGAAVQTLVFLAQRTAVAGPGFDAAQVASATVAAIGTRVVMSTIAGSANAEQLAATAPFVAPVVAAIVVAAVLVLVRNDRERFRHAAAAVALMVAAVALAMSFRGNASGFANYAHVYSRGERYFLLPVGLLVFLFGVAVDGARSRARTYVAAAALLLVVTGVAQNARIAPLPDERWAEYAPRIAAWREADAAHLHAAGVTVPLNPRLQLRLPEEEAFGHDTPERWENKLIRGSGASLDDQKVYVVRHGKRRWIVSPAWMQAHGYRWPGDVNRVRDDVLQMIPLGDPIFDAK